MGASEISGILGALPGGGVAALSIWFALKQTARCNELSDRLTKIAETTAATNQQVIGALDALRAAIREGTR